MPAFGGASALMVKSHVVFAAWNKPARRDAGPDIPDQNVAPAFTM